MEIVCVILAAGWFAVGWLAASRYHEKSRRRLEHRHNEADGVMFSKERSQVPIGDSMRTWDAVVSPERTSIRGEPKSEPQTFAGSINAEQTLSSRPSSSSADAAEQASREFLGFCNQREVPWEQARIWFESHGMNCDRLIGDEDSWYLLVVSQRGAHGTGLGVPAIRRAMGAVPLADYFELTRYNGLDPLEPQNVVQFCEIRVADYTVAQKGTIHGR
jgi:hypothetical protein